MSEVASEVTATPYETRAITKDAIPVGKGGSTFFGASGSKPDPYIRDYAERSGLIITEDIVKDGLPWKSLSAPKAAANCLFIYPGITSPGWGCNRKGQTSNEAVYMSHGMAYVSAALKARGHLARLLDMRTCRAWPDFERRVREAQYDVAFIGFLSLDVFSAACAVRILKEVHPDRPVVVGGLHVSCNEDKEFPPDDIPELWLNRDEEIHPLVREFLAYKGETRYDPVKFPKADCVVWNEAEIAASLIAEDVASGKALPKFINARTIPDLNNTPHCDRGLFDFDLEVAAPLLRFLPKPFATVTFGRGCPLKCTFCNVGTQLSSASVRTIDPEYFMDELQQIKNRYGKLGSLMIHDDILLYPKWLVEWNRKLRDRFGYTPYWCQMRADFIVKFPDVIKEMAECGMAWVSIGLESGSQRILDSMRKQTTVEQNLKACFMLKDLGVNVFGNWMLGLPGEKEEDMLMTAEMMKEIARGGIRHSASVYCNYPGTSMAAQLKLTDGLEDRWYARSHFPWQRAVRGINYQRVYEIQADVLNNAGDHAELPKFWPRGLPTE